MSLSVPPADSLKLLVLGAAGVGKTALIQRFLHDSFEPRHRRTVEELHCLAPVPGALPIRLEILDTSGSYSFPAMLKLRIRQADAFLLVFSLNDQDTFQELERLREEILLVRGDLDAPMVVVGNQTDLFPGVDTGPGQLLSVEAAAVAELQWECGYLETSAKLDHRVRDVFQDLLRRVNLPCLLSPALERRRASAEPEKRQHRRRRQHNCMVS
ncbi:ras-related protein Rap-2c-like [Bombina bombina]|uniref:ras-related protein Rap-2c-like n=1 Tax=Bombina bombina TaxID=8345 RepID=UPI00235B0CF7|nr:ras-related protein Rap-2c-like [Bombina bombina]